MKNNLQIGESSVFEKGLPHAEESEQVMIAQMVLGHLEPSIVFAEISPAQFYTVRYRLLAEIIRDLDRDGMAPDRSMVLQVAIAKGFASTASEALLAIDLVPAMSKWRQHCAQVRKTFVLRELHEKFQALSVLALDQSEDTDAIFGRAQTLIEGLQGESRPHYDDLEHPVDTARREGLSLYNWANKKVCTPFIPMPFESIKETLDGIREGELCILASRPGIGKTSLACRMLEAAAGEAGHMTSFYTLEMSKQAVIARLASGISRVNSRRARLGSDANFPLSNHDRQQYRSAFEWIETWPFEVSQSRNTRVSDIRAAIRPRIAKGMKCLIVDYLGLLSPEERGESRNREVSDISRALKNMAMEFKIAILALHQLNRDNVKQGRRPQLEDLRDSGSLEQDADIVLILHPLDFEPISKTEIIIAKQREGPTGPYEVEYVRNFARFQSVGGDDSDRPLDRQMGLA